jgi:hypothetical protein
MPGRREQRRHRHGLGSWAGLLTPTGAIRHHYARGFFWLHLADGIGIRARFGGRVEGLQLMTLVAYEIPALAILFNIVVALTSAAVIVAFARCARTNIVRSEALAITDALTQWAALQRADQAMYGVKACGRPRP